MCQQCKNITHENVLIMCRGGIVLSSSIIFLMAPTQNLHLQRTMIDMSMHSTLFIRKVSDALINMKISYHQFD